MLGGGLNSLFQLVGTALTVNLLGRGLREVMGCKNKQQGPTPAP